ncbi:hypothetical protein OIT44_03745 [Weissella ceti]|uniref:Uncharacterized protein n=1 Tax=Weissella ceti TaxID=759620 RepID=A0ABT3E452_9LACO|nr:hypothetical protein [Weissella ceti]MCW0953186.1 hypothetical protein [Weissella ceti]QVK12704.1 hypothetical protein KHQ31_03510 [Weissella ceti]
MHQFHWTPDYWSGLGKREKAMIIAGIDLRTEAEEKERKRAEKKSKGRRR